MKAILLLSLAAGLSLAACGSAGPERRPGMAAPGMAEPAGACLLTPFVTNADGSLDRPQLDAALKAAFARADANGDGALGKQEIVALNAARAATCDRTPFIDWSETGRMSFAAFAARYYTAFSRADIDEDGRLTAAEIKGVVRRHERRERPRQEGEYRGPETPN